jgi:hypothetical protein
MYILRGLEKGKEEESIDQFLFAFSKKRKFIFVLTSYYSCYKSYYLVLVFVFMLLYNMCFVCFEMLCIADCFFLRFLWFPFRLSKVWHLIFCWNEIPLFQRAISRGYVKDWVNAPPFCAEME